MNTVDSIIIDIQGFKDYNNDFIVKEIVILESNTFHYFLVRPPFPFEYLSNEEKRTVKWVERNHGILWREGVTDYYIIKNLVEPLMRMKIILVKGVEKIKWLKEFCYDCTIINLEDFNCPSFFELYKLYSHDNERNCVHHKTNNCAVTHVKLLKKWIIDNKIKL